MAAGEQQGGKQQHRAIPVRRQQSQRGANASLGHRHPEARVDRAKHAALLEREQGRERVGLAQRESQLGPDARTRDGGEGARAEGLARQRGGALLGLEMKARGISPQAQQPSRVVEEAALVKDAQAPAVEVGEGVLDGSQLALAPAAEREGDRVDGEIAALEVLLDRAASHLRERARRGI